MATALTLAALAAGATSVYPARMKHFGNREKQLAQMVKTYVDSLSPDTLITTRGDVISGDASGDAQRVALGASGRALVSDGTDAAWSAGQTKHYAKATIGFAALNAAGAAVAVPAGNVIPVGAIVTRVFFDVTAAFTGDVDSTATLSIGIQDQDNDVQAAAAVSGAPFSGTGLEEGSVGIDGTVAKALVISASAKQCSATIAALNNDSAFTAGSVDIYAEYIV